MSNLVNPLQSVINQASQVKSKNSTLERYAKRINANPAGKSVILLDVSGSMSGYVGSEMKINILRQALDRPLEEYEVAIAFNSTTFLLPNLQSIPEPDGTTALHLALEEAKQYNPRHTLVVSDGIPDSNTDAIRSAKKLPGIISTLYIGDEDDTNAIAFMQELAHLGCGKWDICDLRKQKSRLKTAIHLLLPGK
jgi:hypothetical protein